MAGGPEIQTRGCLTACVNPNVVVCAFALLVNSYLLYLLSLKSEHQSGDDVSKCFLPPTPNATKPPPPPWFLPGIPPPAWSTPEEQAVLQQSIKRWHFAAGICEGCQEYRYKRVINPSPSTCSPMINGTQPSLLILISTVHRHRTYRDLIRETWGSHTHNNTGRTRMVFLLGKDPGKNLTEEKMLQKEGAAFGDILQDDFDSTYRRGGEIQLIMGYRWARKQCANVTHIVKVSDDVYVSVPQVLKLIAKVNLTNVVYGTPIWASGPVRQKTHRWYTSPDTWPAKGYPSYVTGFFIGLTMPVLRRILLVFPYLAWSAGADDAIVGICANKMATRILGVGGLHQRWNKHHPCNISGEKNAIHIHGYSPKVFSYLWTRRDCFEGGMVHIGPKNDSNIYKTGVL